MREDGNTDLYSLVSLDNGDSWTLPIRINDDSLGNHIDQFHPSISITESGIVTATWYDRRNDLTNLKFDCYMAHSFDGGLTWTANRRFGGLIFPEIKHLLSWTPPDTWTNSTTGKAQILPLATSPVPIRIRERV